MQTNQTSRERSHYPCTIKTRLCYSYPPIELSTDLTSQASRTQDNSNLGRAVVSTRKHKGLYLKRNHVGPIEDGQLLEAPSAGQPAKAIDEISVIHATGGANFTSSPGATYCFGMVSLLAADFNVDKVNRLLRYLETLPCSRSQKVPRAYCFGSAVKLCCN